MTVVYPQWRNSTNVPGKQKRVMQRAKRTKTKAEEGEMRGWERLQFKSQKQDGQTQDDGSQLLEVGVGGKNSVTRRNFTRNQSQDSTFIVRRQDKKIWTRVCTGLKLGCFLVPLIYHHIKMIIGWKNKRAERRPHFENIDFLLGNKRLPE